MFPRAQALGSPGRGGQAGPEERTPKNLEGVTDVGRGVGGLVAEAGGRDEGVGFWGGRN